MATVCGLASVLTMRGEPHLAQNPRVVVVPLSAVTL
jgi:hypothetical protein